MNIVQIGAATIRVFHETQYLDVTFEDGTQAVAAANYDQASIDRATELGHADQWSACVWHEIGHCVASLAMGSLVSKTLHGAAKKAAGIGGYCKYWAWEERVVFSLTSYALTGQWARWLDTLGFNTATYLDCLGWHCGDVGAVRDELVARVREAGL